MKTSFRFVLLLAMAVAGSGCVVDDNEGPRGPQGPPGNANVFSLNFDFFLADAVFNGTVASVQFDIPALTGSVVDDGAVLLFFRDQGTWTAMPYTYGVESPDVAAVDYTVSLGFGYEVGFLEVFYETSIDAIDITSLPDREIKAVVIDGFPFGKKSIDFTDWNAVKEAFNLSD